MVTPRLVSYPGNDLLTYAMSLGIMLRCDSYRMDTRHSRQAFVVLPNSLVRRTGYLSRCGLDRDCYFVHLVRPQTSSTYLVFPIAGLRWREPSTSLFTDAISLDGRYSETPRPIPLLNDRTESDIFVDCQS